MQETEVRSLGWEDPLEKGMATYSSTVAWRIQTSLRSKSSVTHSWSDFRLITCQIFILYELWKLHAEKCWSVSWQFSRCQKKAKLPIILYPHRDSSPRRPLRTLNTWEALTHNIKKRWEDTARGQKGTKSKPRPTGSILNDLLNRNRLPIRWAPHSRFHKPGWQQPTFSFHHLR